MESLVLRLFRLLAALLDSPVSLLPMLNLLLALNVLEFVRRSRGESSWLLELSGRACWEDVIVNDQGIRDAEDIIQVVLYQVMI